MTEPHALDGRDRLETPERVDLERPIAGIGSRSLAVIIDSLLLMVAMVALFFITIALIPVSGMNAFVLPVIVMFLASWFYFAAFEWAWEGQTPGKRALGLRVQKDGGYPIGPSEALIRNFFRPLIDMGTIPVGILVMLISDRSKRIGDYAAGTVVVHEGREEKQTLRQALRDVDEVEHSRAIGMTAKEEELVRDVLRRGPSLQPPARRELYRRLADQLQERFRARGRAPRIPTQDDEIWLNRLLLASSWEEGTDGPA